MRDATADFAAAVTSSHRAETVVEVWRGTEQLAESVPIEAGDISWDDTQQIAGDVTISVPAGPNREWDPTGDPFHPLSPFGQRLYVSRGITYPSGTRELLGLGWFVITDADPDPLGEGVKVKAASLERILDESKFQTPLKPKSGGTFDSEARRLVTSQLPMDDLDPALTDRAVPSSILWEDNKLAAMTALCAAWPARLRVNSEGLVQLLAPYPDDPAAGTPVLTLSTGVSGVVAEWQTTTSRDEIYNAVIARGESDTENKAAVSAIAWDASAASPTFWNGPFGWHALEYSSPLLTTTAQALNAARTMLAKRLRRTRTAVVTMVPDPRIETGDYVRLETPTVSGIGRVSGVRLPLGGDGGPGSLTVEMGA